MDVLQLQDKEQGWRIYRFPTAEERDSALAQHGIVIGHDVSFGRYAMIGDNVRLGSGVRLAEESVVAQGARLGDKVSLGYQAHVGESAVIGDAVTLAEGAFVGRTSKVGSGCIIGKDAEIDRQVTIGSTVKLGQGCFVMQLSRIDDGVTVGRSAYIGERSQIGYFAAIGEDAELVRDVIVQEGTQIPDGRRVSSFSTVSRTIIQDEWDRLVQAVGYMSGRLSFDQIGKFVAKDGTTCIRAQIAGVWTPSRRLGTDELRAVASGDMTLRDLCDRHIAPIYQAHVGQSIAEQRGAGRRL